MPKTFLYQHEKRVVIAAVRDAAELLIREAHLPGGPRGRGGTAPIDVEMGDLLCRRIGAAFPRDTLISEENPGSFGRSGRTFYIDPHDGTQAFLRGRRETSLSVALVVDGRLALGVVFAPFGTPWSGSQSLLASWSHGDRLRWDERAVRARTSPARLGSNDVVLVSSNLSAPLLAQNRRLLAPAQVEPCASIATRLALVALGAASATLTVNRALEPWDFAAGQALLRAAGGDLFGWRGKPLSWPLTDRAPNQAPPHAYFGTRSPGLALYLFRRMSSLIRS